MPTSVLTITSITKWDLSSKTSTTKKAQDKSKFSELLMDLKPSTLPLSILNSKKNPNSKSEFQAFSLLQWC
jgi:hypothetical protein